MKHNFLFGAMLFTACVFSANVKAQLEVQTSGDVLVSKNLEVRGTLKAKYMQIDEYQLPNQLSTLGIGSAALNNAKLTIKGTGVGSSQQYGVYSSLSYGTGNVPAIAIFGSSTGLHTELIGVKGAATGNSTRPTAPAIGVYGISGGNTSGKNYGVFGVLQDGSQNGAGVYGSTSTTIQAVPGRYAGYFNGQTKVNGHIFADNISESSDARLKTNITSINKDAMAKIKDLRAVQYNWSKDANKDHKHLSENTDFNRKHYGFIAQEVQKIYPELVYTDDEGYLSINYTELIPFLIQAVQELSTEVEQLKKANK